MNARFSNTAATLSRAIRLIWMSSPLLALWHTVLTILQACLPLISILALKQIIDSATKLYADGLIKHATIQSALELYGNNPDFTTLAHWSLLAAICVVINAFLKIALAWISEFHSIAVTDEIYKKLHTTLIKADYAFFENPDDQNDLYMAREQAILRPLKIIGGLSQLIQSITALTGALIILFSFAPLLPLLLCISVIPGMILKIKRSQRFFGWRRGLIPSERECAYFHSVMTANEGAKEIRMYGHGDFCQEKFQRARDFLKKQRKAWRVVVLQYDLTALAVGFVISGIALLWLMNKTLTGALSVGALVLCIQSLRRGQSVITVISTATASLLEDSIFLQSYEELLNREPRIKTPLQPASIPSPIKKGIVFERVSFTYQGASTPALRDISLTLETNQRIALAGANGAGKSTLIKLLCRLYDPTAGRILVDGTDLKEFDPEAWREQIGVLFQDYNTYQLSAEDNIRIGHPEYQPDDPRIKEAAEAAGLTPFIKQWPDDIKTLLGRWLHNGIEPSTGLWQKIALARAFLRPANLYLLDEPTSALDGAAQKEALESLNRLSRGKLTLFTSHRSLPVGLADRIIILSDGSVAADGTPDQLSTNPEFKNLFKGA